MTKRLIFDAHLDLAMNALEWNRDLSRPLAEIRQRDRDQTPVEPAGKTEPTRRRAADQHGDLEVGHAALQLGQLICE